MLDLDFDEERRRSGQDNRDLVLALLLFLAVLERLARLHKRGRRLCIDLLSESERLESPVAVVEVVGQPREPVRVLSRLGSVHGDGCLAKGGIEVFASAGNGSLHGLVSHFVLDVIRWRSFNSGVSNGPGEIP